MADAGFDGAERSLAAIPIGKAKARAGRGGIETLVLPPSAAVVSIGIALVRTLHAAILLWTVAFPGSGFVFAHALSPYGPWSPPGL